MDDIGNAAHNLRRRKAFVLHRGGLWEWDEETMRDGWELGPRVHAAIEAESGPRGFDAIVERGYAAHPQSFVDLIA